MVCSRRSFVDVVREVTDGEGAAVVYEAIGRDTLQHSLDSLRPMGVCAAYGHVSGPPDPVDIIRDLGTRGSLFITRPAIWLRARGQRYKLRRARRRRAQKRTYEYASEEMRVGETEKAAARFRSQASGPTVRLLEGPQESLERFAEATTRWLDPRTYNIGGGTALEARWHHRNSIDVDLFAPRRTLEQALREHRAEIRAALRTLAAERGEQFQIGYDFVSVQLSGAPVNMIVDQEMTKEPHAHEYVEGTAVRAQTTEEILAKKLHLRVIADRRYEARDFYDMGWCAEREPETWKRAIVRVDEKEWMNIAYALERLPETWGEGDAALKDATDTALVTNLRERSITRARNSALDARLRSIDEGKDGRER